MSKSKSKSKKTAKVLRLSDLKREVEREIKLHGNRVIVSLSIEMADDRRTLHKIAKAPA